MLQKLKGKILEIKQLTTSVNHYTIELNENLNFKAGQFINLSFEEKNEKYLRPYSIASIPNNSNKIELCIKLIESGKLTPKLFKKKENSEINIMGPLGLFQMKNEKEKLVFIGTGTGIAPLRSMILNLLYNQKIEKEILLIFGTRNENEILYQEEFEKLEKENPNFKFIPIISKPTDKWQGRQNHVQNNFDIIDPINSEIYLCGLPQMIEESTQKLLEKGILKENIISEKY